MSAIIELINTGSELMLGFVLNTHQQWLCRSLSDAGYTVARQTAVPDTASDIQRTVREALGRADFVIVTGGLGPTSDDLTRDLIAQLLGRKLDTDANVLQRLERFFSERGRPMPPHTAVQAQVPDGALVLTNHHGTAPGLAMEINPNPFRADGKTSWLVMLPGPPRELRPMFTEQALPLLRKELPLDGAFICRTIRSTGMGESIIEEKIAAALQPLTTAGLELGYCAHYGEVDVRLIARGTGAEKLAAEAEELVRERLGSHVFGAQDDQLNAVVVRLLTDRKETLTLAESCTGGFVANSVTDVPGASAIFLGGFVTYSNEAKQRLLGVRAETLAQHGAVSEPTAREMAEGARDRLGADYALSITGIAGPGGGTEAKPVGTVFIALTTARHTFVLNPVNRYDRPTFKQITCLQALELLRRTLLKG
ncbi:MAG TPA: competence/damage-inducible protein A [Verrucomicrobiae bacterium]|nr:competence/damage-inducible protein A [Verrucomicrobiae bacterium]